MMMVDEKKQFVRLVPVGSVAVGVALAVFAMLQLSGVVNVQITKKHTTDMLLLLGGLVFVFLAILAQWRTCHRQGDTINVKSLLKKYKFTVQRTNVFIEREIVRRQNRNKTVFEVGFEDGIDHLILRTCPTSQAANAVAAKLRRALGLGLHDSWMR